MDCHSTVRSCLWLLIVLAVSPFLTVKLAGMSSPLSYSPGNTTSCPVETLDTNFSDIGLFRTLVTCDSNGMILEELYQEFYGGEVGWVDQVRNSYTTDAAGIVREGFNYRYTSREWVVTGYKTYVYDEAGNLFRRIGHVLNGESWSPSFRYTYTYNSEGDLTDQVGQRMEADWVNSTRSTYEYDALGNLSAQLYSGWTAETWTLTSKQAYVYTGTSLPSQMLEQRRDE